MEIETDKAAVEIPSPFTGAVQEILVQVGDMAHVGDVLMTFTSEETEAAVRPAEPQQTETAVAQQEGYRPGQKRRPVPASASRREPESDGRSSTCLPRSTRSSRPTWASATWDDPTATSPAN